MPAAVTPWLLLWRCEMKKLHVKVEGVWRPVFCYLGERIITCEDPKKALPPYAYQGKADLAYFSRRFGNNEFALFDPKTGGPK